MWVWHGVWLILMYLNRPLPEDMIKYAREDTHYLLYVYDRLRNELIRRSNSQSNLINAVLRNSQDISLKVYRKPALTDDSYLKLCKKFNKRNLSHKQVIIIIVFIYVCLYYIVVCVEVFVPVEVQHC